MVHILRSGWCKNELAMHLLRSLFFWLARTQVTLEAVHIPGRDNGPADSLSRNDPASFMSQVPYSQVSQSRILPAVEGVVDKATPRLDIANLDSLVGRYFAKRLAESTRKSYSSSQKHYLHFCKEASLQPLPASEATLCYFAAYLARGIKT